MLELEPIRRYLGILLYIYKGFVTNVLEELDDGRIDDHTGRPGDFLWNCT